METLAVGIPEIDRDNSEKITDYAFRRDLSGHEWAHGYMAREKALLWSVTHKYDVYTWQDENPDGQRCRFDMLVSRDTGQVVHLFHTEYFTRVACAECEYSYASVYQVINTEDGMSEAVPRCDEHADRFRRLCASEGVTIYESERLLIGQHD